MALYWIYSPVFGLKKNKTNKQKKTRSSRRGAAEMNLTRNCKVVGSIPGLARRVKDLALLWLWHRLAALAPIRPIAWEPPCATCAALKKTKDKKRKQKQKNGVMFLRFTHIVVFISSL